VPSISFALPGIRRKSRTSSLVKELEDTGQPVVPELMASRIIAAAKLGEHNPVRLREAALRKPE
jgi:hypothetical protein